MPVIDHNAVTRQQGMPACVHTGTVQAKTVEGYDKKIFYGASHQTCAPYFQIRSSATVHASVMCEYMKHVQRIKSQ